MCSGLHPSYSATRPKDASIPGPVCSNAEYLGDNGLSAPGQQWANRQIYYCPQGATSLQLQFAGTYAFYNPVREVALVDPQLMNLSIETYVPPLWNPATTYQPGAQVSGPVGSDSRGRTFVAVSRSVRASPRASDSAHWSLVSPTVVPVTCAGTRPCALGTSTQNGVTRSDEFLITDTVAVDIPPGTLIAVRQWLSQSGGQQAATGPAQTQRSGSYQNRGTTQPDLTLGGGVVPQGSAQNMGPFAIVGTQNVAVPAPSVCIIGDSRAVGLAGNGIGAFAIANGGFGYTSTDVGKLVANVDSGQSPDNVFSSASYVIQAVSGGQVTKLGVYDPGHYAPPVTTGGAGVATTNPSGVQATRPLFGTNGSGLTVSLGPLSGSTGTHEDSTTYAQGFVQKGLSDGGIPFASFSRSSDMVGSWVTSGGDTERLAAIKRSGCTSVVIALGINDSNAGSTPELIEQQLTTLAYQLIDLGTTKGIYLATMPPYTFSNDYWATVAGQTRNAYDATRVAVNTWERLVPFPFAGTFDTAAPVEVNASGALAINGGYWITNGTPHYATLDKIHLSPATHDLAARAISASVGILR